MLDARAVGIVASAAIISDFMIIASRIGMMESIQRLESNPRVESAAFWFTALTGSAASIFVLLASFLVRSWGNAPEVANVLVIMSAIPVLAAVTAIPEGIIRRSLNFRALTFRTWVATLIGAGVAIAMVQRGFGLYALAGQRVTSAFCSMILIWAQAQWRPHFRPAIAPAYEVIRTGSMILVGSFSGLINQHIADSITAIFLEIGRAHV